MLVQARTRAGYTLLEVILSIGIGLLVVLALYAALSVQMSYMQTGRSAVEEGKLARGILDRMARDIRPSLALLPEQPSSPFKLPRLPGGNSPLPEDTAPMEPGSSSPEDPMNPDDPAMPGIADTSGLYRQVVDCQSDHVTLGTGTRPLYTTSFDDVWSGGDFRYIHYRVDPEVGLIREVSMTPPNSLEDTGTQSDVLAPEVKELSFLYFGRLDLTSEPGWMTSWPSAATYGPPEAVKITILLESPVRGGPTRQTRYSMVVSVPGAAIPQEAVNAAVGGGP